MKTITYITIFSLLAILFTDVMAGGTTKRSTTAKTDIVPVNELYRLAPVTPAEATFDDETEIFRSISLIPYTPGFAEDFLPEPSPSAAINIAPVVPIEATFDEEITTDGYTTEFLEFIQPSVPQEATFEDMN